MIKLPIDKLKKNINKKVTNAEIERGIGMLKSLRIVTNVLYALMIYAMFEILPAVNDPHLANLKLKDIIAENQSAIIIIGIGIIMILIYWVQGNLQFGNLIRSSPAHALLAMVQLVCLMLYIYFLILEIGVSNSALALKMQSSLLAATGLIGAINWRYARYKKFTSDQIDDKEEMDLFYKILPEPITALITIPFAAYGTTAWSLAWLSIIPVGFMLKLARKRFLE